MKVFNARNIGAALLPLLAAASFSACAAQGDPAASLTARGKKVFDHWCISCHGAGERMPGTASLAVKYGGQVPAALEERGDMTPAFVRHFVREGVMIMPPFRKAEITDADLEALAAYLGSKKN